jgi:hypothetical protein
VYKGFGTVCISGVCGGPGMCLCCGEGRTTIQNPGLMKTAGDKAPRNGQRQCEEQQTRQVSSCKGRTTG